MYVRLRACSCGCLSWSIKWVYNAASALSRNQRVVRRPIDHTNSQFNEPMCIRSFNRSTGLHFGDAKQEDGSHESFNARLCIRSITASLETEYRWNGYPTSSLTTPAVFANYYCEKDVLINKILVTYIFDVYISIKNLSYFNFYTLT